MLATQDYLGIGIYTPAEAAFYAGVSPRLMTRWVFGDSDGKPVIERELQQSEEKIVTFLDFVQTLAVREIRRRYKLPLQRIRQGVDAARQQYGLEYPLAHKHRIFLFSDQQGDGHGEILIRLEGDTEDVEARYAQLTGKGKGNFLFRQVVETFLSDLTFDSETNRATQYRPMIEDEFSVLLDPHRRFGEPVLEQSGYSVKSLWHATNAEGGLEEAAEAYGIPVQEVILANRYFDMILSQSMA